MPTWILTSSSEAARCPENHPGWALVANTCIESTGRFGMELGYHVTLVKDATAAFSREAMHAAQVNGPTFAHAILTTAELLAAIG